MATNKEQTVTETKSNRFGKELTLRAPFFTFSEGAVLEGRIKEHQSKRSKFSGEMQPICIVELLSDCVVKENKKERKAKKGETVAFTVKPRIQAISSLPIGTELQLTVLGKTATEKGDAWDFEVRLAD